MKKIEFGFITLFIIGIVFFLFRWPFASELLIISIGSLVCLYMYFGSIIFYGTSIKNIFKKNKSENGKAMKLIGGGFFGILLSVNILGTLFKLMNWPFSMEMIIVSLPVMIIVLLMVFFLNLKNKTIFYENIIKRYAIWGLFSLMLISLPKYFILEYRYAAYPGYINAIKAYGENPTDENYDAMELELEKTYFLEE